MCYHLLVPIGTCIAPTPTPPHTQIKEKGELCLGYLMLTLASTRTKVYMNLHTYMHPTSIYTYTHTETHTKENNKVMHDYSKYFLRWTEEDKYRYVSSLVRQRIKLSVSRETWKMLIKWVTNSWPSVLFHYAWGYPVLLSKMGWPSWAR